MQPSPVQVLGLTDVVSVKAGAEHSLALRSDGTVWRWGHEAISNGGAGRGIGKPERVEGLWDIVAVDAGSDMSLALRADGTVWRWGTNELNRLPSGYWDQYLTPVHVAGITQAVAIAMNFHLAALRADGTVWVQGSNLLGQLGDGTQEPRGVEPVQVRGLTGVVAIDVSATFSLALRADGTVWAWGVNTLGQLGVGTTDELWFPVRVKGLTDVVAVSAGSAHSLALRADGTVWAWGSAILGDGTETSSALPVQVKGLPDVVAMSAGGGYSLALSKDGQIWAWGSNRYGQLGNGIESTINRELIPIQVP